MGIKMPYYLKYIISVFSRIPNIHWVVIGGLAFLMTLFFLIQKRFSVYSAIVLGAVTLVGLIVLEMTVVVRLTGIMPHGYGFDLVAGFHRLFNGGERGLREIITNIIVFVPFGFLLSEFFSSIRLFRVWRQVGYVILATFSFSLCIESLQLILHVGFFEMTDLLMNTLGALVGAGVSLLARGVRTQLND